MSRLGVIKCILETAVTWLLLQFFPFTMHIKLRFIDWVSSNAYWKPP